MSSAHRDERLHSDWWRATDGAVTNVTQLASGETLLAVAFPDTSDVAAGCQRAIAPQPRRIALDERSAHDPLQAADPPPGLR
jgi:hypothetical protein